MSHTPPPGPDGPRPNSSDDPQEPWQTMPPAPWENGPQTYADQQYTDQQSSADAQQLADGQEPDHSQDAGQGAAQESGGSWANGAWDSDTWGGASDRPPPGHVYPDDPFEPSGATSAAGAEPGSQPASGESPETVYEVAPYPTSWPPPSPYDQQNSGYGPPAGYGPPEGHDQPVPGQPDPGQPDPGQPDPGQPAADAPYPPAQPTAADPHFGPPQGPPSGAYPANDGYSSAEPPNPWRPGPESQPDSPWQQEAAEEQASPAEQTNPAEPWAAPPDSESTQLAMRPYNPPPPPQTGASHLPPQTGPAHLPPQTGPTHVTPENGPAYGEQPDYAISYAAPGNVPPLSGGPAPDTQDDKPKSSKKGLAWVALSLVVLLIAAAAVWFFVFRGDDSNNAGGDGDQKTSAESSESGGDPSGSGDSESEGSAGSEGSSTDEAGKLKPELQTAVQALYDGYNKAWDTAAASGDFAPVAKYAVDNAHPDAKPDEAQCQAHNQNAGAVKGYRQKFTIDFATAAAAPDWMPPGATEPPSGDVFVATAEWFGGTGLTLNPQPIEVHFAIVDGKAYMFPDCS